MVCFLNTVISCFILVDFLKAFDVTSCLCCFLALFDCSWVNSCLVCFLLLENVLTFHCHLSVCLSLPHGYFVFVPVLPVLLILNQFVVYFSFIFSASFLVGHLVFVCLLNQPCIFCFPYLSCFVNCLFLNLTVNCKLANVTLVAHLTKMVSVNM